MDSGRQKFSAKWWLLAATFLTIWRRPSTTREDETNGERETETGRDEIETQSVLSMLSTQPWFL